VYALAFKENDALPKRDRRPKTTTAFQADQDELDEALSAYPEEYAARIRLPWEEDLRSEYPDGAGGS